MTPPKGKTPAKTPAKPNDDGTAARRESGGEPVTIEFQGLELKIPPKLPFKMLPLFAKVQASQSREDLQMPALVNLVEGILGEQAEQVWNLDLDLETGAEALGELFGEVMAAYGLDSGKSEASPGS